MHGGDIHVRSAALPAGGTIDVVQRAGEKDKRIVRTISHFKLKFASQAYEVAQAQRVLRRSGRQSRYLCLKL